MKLKKINDFTAKDNNYVWFRTKLRTVHSTWPTCESCAKRTDDYWEEWPNKGLGIICNDCIEWETE